MNAIPRNVLTKDQPRARLKVTLAATRYAAELLNELSEPAQRLLGHEPGACYAEVIDGHQFVAYRLECGGVDLREVVGETSRRAA